MLAATTFLVLAAGCGKNDDSATPPWRPDLVCPGDEGCTDADGPMTVGTAVADISPPCWETWTDIDDSDSYSGATDTFDDCGCDQLCPDDDGYAGPDEGEGDGVFQTAWLAGFGHARAVKVQNDPLETRAAVIEQGQTSLALVSVDTVGIFNDDVDLIREELASQGVDIDLVLLSSSHVHEGPDTMGLWGKAIGESGVDPDYMAFLRSNVVGAIADAAADARTVGEMSLGKVAVDGYHPNGTWNILSDTRDPKIMDEVLYTAHFADESGETIATIVNFGLHPETVPGDNIMTADFPGVLRTTVEEGATWDSYSRQGLGGTCIFINAAVGGMMTTLRNDTEDPDGVLHDSNGLEKMEAIGKQLGEMALDAVMDGTSVQPSLGFRHQRMYLPIDNQAFQAMYLIGVLAREAYNYDEDADLSANNVPELLTEMNYVELGPARLLSVPGELLPELAVGGYDGSRVNTDVEPIIDDDNENPPDLGAAPEGPYLKDLMGAEHSWIVGLGNDELGYIIPEYNFQVDDGVPYLIEAPGHHYEETNSLGPRTAGLVDDMAADLISWQP